MGRKRTSMISVSGFQRVLVAAFLLTLGNAAPNLHAQTYLIKSGDFWTYWDFGFQPDPDWASPAVNFYRGNTLLATDTDPPYEAVLSSVQPSNYVLRAVALFNDSTTLTSAPVHLTAAAARLTRGPYLQLGTPTSVIVKWRTDFASDSVVRYGLSSESLNQSAAAPGAAIEHEVQLSGLVPDTQYYYSIGSSTTTLAGGPDYYFVTAPLGAKPTRIWVIGDSGGAASSSIPNDHGSYLVRDAYYDYAYGRYTDLWLMMGDNAYDRGTDDEYQRGMFDVYPALLRNTVVWSTIGNHEVNTEVYFNIFSLPKNGEAGGVPSGVENYYSFNYGDIHFVCLAGYYSGSRLSNGVMCAWLKADLAANTNKWLIAFWHQPPYTKGSHDSDWETDLIEMRENAVPILESYGVDLVLCGHSHVYERSYLLHGHYGDTSAFEWSMAQDPGSGRIDDTGPYVKQTSGPQADLGTVYVVAGSGAWIANCCNGLNHPAMYRSLAEIGSLVLDIDGDILQGTFVRGDGVVDDYFTLVKNSTVLWIVSIGLQGGSTRLAWTSVPGRRYQVEFTGNLGTGWTPVDDPVEATGALTAATYSTANPASGFYRVVEQP